MGYRGTDLDLRTTRPWSAASAELVGGERNGPIWVDDTVLACANHAYDVALAHRCGEVRLEHLLHALTRVEAAAAALEARGVRVVALRRDSAIVIASDIPAGLPETANGPQRSPELEDVLRIAAAQAAQAGRPASVDDILHVLIDLRSDSPGNELLMRHLPRASRDFWSSLGPARGTYTGRLVDASEAERARTAHLPRPLLRPEQRSAAEYTILQGMLDRLAEIEQVMSDRLAAVETRVAGGVSDPDGVGRRLEALEGAALAWDGEGVSALKQRLSALERLLAEERAERSGALAALAADVKALTSALGCTSADGSTQQPSIAERIQLLAADLELHRIELGASLGDRIAAIEKSVEAQGAKVAEARDAYVEEIAEVHDALMKLSLDHQSLASSIEQWRGSDAGEIQLINARIGAVQEDGSRRLQVLERLCMDVEALSHVALTGKPANRWFSHWLFGTDDWIKASWPMRSKAKD